MFYNQFINIESCIMHTPEVNVLGNLAIEALEVEIQEIIINVEIPHGTILLSIVI